MLLATPAPARSQTADTTSVAPATSADSTRVWAFRVLLDGDPIGWHRFTLRPDTTDTADDTSPETASDIRPRRRLDSEAEFSVRLLGLTVYRYRHRATELWRGDCLGSLVAQTDDNGSPIRVEARRQGERLQISASPAAPPAGADPRPPTGCLMSFAYWHPALSAQTRLLNPQTGAIEAVRFTPLPPRTLDVQGRPTAVRGWRLQGAARPVEVWYSARGDDWVGLDAEVSGGRRLSYRLE